MSSIHAKTHISSDHIILSLMIWERFRCHCSNTTQSARYLLLCRGLRLATLPHRWWTGLLQYWLSFWRLFLFPHKCPGNQRVAIGLLGRIPDKGPLPCFRFRWVANSWKSPGDCKLQSYFPRFVPPENPVSEGYRQFIWLHAWSMLSPAMSNVAPHIDRRVPLQIMPN